MAQIVAAAGGLPQVFVHRQHEAAAVVDAGQPVAEGQPRQLALDR
jgi:hypothetical protein